MNMCRASVQQRVGGGMFRLLAVDSLEWSIGGQGAMPVIPYHCSQAGKDERKQRQDFDFSQGDLYSGFFFQRQSTHFLIPLILEGKNMQGIMGNGGWLEMTGSFSLQNENLMHPLTKGDDFTPPSLYFLSGHSVPFSSHTRESRVWRGMLGWELSLHGNTVRFLPSAHTFLAWEMLHFVRIKALKGTFLLFTHRKNSLLTETPH